MGGPGGYAYPNERGFLLKRGITVVRGDALRKLMWSAYEAADVFSERLVGPQYGSAPGWGGHAEADALVFQ